MKSKRLGRQLKKTFGDQAIDESLIQLKSSLAGLADDEARERLTTVIDTFPDFLAMVDEAYGQLEDKIQMAQRNLEVSSQELTSANGDLFRLNQTFDAMVNSLGQGFIIFGADGKCLPVHSKACVRLLEANPASKPLVDVLRVPEERRACFLDWINLLFEEVIDFEDLVDVGPKTFPHSEGLVVSLEFKPVRGREGKLENVVVIATDRTTEVRAKQEAYRMHAFATMVTSILKDKNQFRDFVQVSREIIEDATRLVDQKAFGPADFAAVKRGLHTLKGAAGTFGVLQVKDLVHEIETRISAENDLSWAQEHLRDSLGEVKGLFEALLAEHKELFDEVLQHREPVREVPLGSLKRFASRLEKDASRPLVDEFRDEFMTVPATQVFARFNAVLADAAKKLGKKIDPIEFSGDAIRIVPEAYQGFLSSLVHVFRNIADHGIECEAKRRERGKKASGRVRVTTTQGLVQGRSALHLVIEDDGSGIEVERIRSKLRESGRESLAREANDEQLMNLIFDAGFSTARQVSEMSGRGVGLDAVKHEVEKLGGQITVSSQPGLGTRFTILVPLCPSADARAESRVS